MSKKDKFTGCLIGLAVGDALGAPLEFLLDHKDVVDIHGDEVKEMIGGGWLNLKPGEYTDDTQMTLCIARSLVELKRFDTQDIAKRFVEWLDSDPPDIGHTTKTALNFLKQNPDRWDGGSQTTGQTLASNGSMMRCAPVALFFAGDEKQLVSATRDSSVITHGEPRAIESCVAINLLIDRFISRDYEVDMQQLFAEEVAIDLEESMVVGIIENFEPKPYENLRSSGFCLDTLECALWCTVLSNSFEEALIKAVNLGGDADTVGAVTGALAGALWGLGGIPERWISVLKDREEIHRLAEEIYAINQTKGY